MYKQNTYTVLRTKLKMGKNKLNKKDSHVFFASFLILVILCATFTYIIANHKIRSNYEVIEKATLDIAEGYSRSLINTKTATDFIAVLLEEKLLSVGHIVSLVEDNQSNQTLKELTDKFKVDQINVLNKHGEIMYSNIEEFVGWQAYEEHPVHDFMSSNQEFFIEDIRQDTENGLFYKFGYIKGHDNRFIQIGMLVENIYRFLETFQIQQLIDEIAKRRDVQHAFFTDTDFQLVASSMPEYTGRIIQNEHIREQISVSEEYTKKTIIEEENVLHVCTPIFYNNEKLGTLSIVWPSTIIDKEIRGIVLNNIFNFLFIISTIGSILYYTYRKNKLHINIAYYDKLTGLPNAEYLQEYLEQGIREVGKNKKAVMLLNCKNFETINMTYGFRYGDEIIRQVVNRVGNLLDSPDMFFRFKTDRFILFIENYTESKELEDLAKKLVGIFEAPFIDGTKHHYISGEIAILEIQDEYISVDKALKDVSLALRKLRQESNKNIVFYNTEMETAVQREDKIEKALIGIIQGEDIDSFYLEFQPKMDLKENKIIGFEALARMNIQGLGNISPLEFISLAEKRKLIYDLGNLILQKSCEFLVRLKNSGYNDVSVAVNISSIQLLRDEFIDAIKGIIISTGINPHLLEFEITESMLIDNYDLINEKLAHIKDLGISVSLDDFGTGFSSFARLRNLNIDIVKMDSFFVNRLDKYSEKNLITADIISMAHKIDLLVIAEGVEKEKQKDYLQKYNCDIIQGYLLSKPLPEDDAIKFLEHGKRPSQ